MIRTNVLARHAAAIVAITSALAQNFMSSVRYPHLLKPQHRMPSRRVGQVVDL